MDSIVRAKLEAISSRKTSLVSSAVSMVSGLGGAVATLAALLVGAILALAFAATLVVIAVLASALLGLGAIAWRMRRQPASRDPGVLEAHRAGHAWVVYGCDRSH